jgi:hypothetical protein
MSHTRTWVLAAGAVAAVAATVVGIRLLTDDPAGESAGPAATATPSGEPAATSSPSESTTATLTREEAVPVYYVGDAPTGPRLFREFHRLQVAEGPAAVAEAALGEALADSALDPDYRSPWAGVGSLGRVQAAPGDEIVTVDLAGDLHDRPAGMARAEAEMAVEQLVHTVQAAVQRRAPVQFMLNGGRTDTLLGVPVSEPLAAGDPMEVQATVWVISPQEGDKVTSPFPVEGRGAFFEATVSWQLLRDGEVVEEGFATAEEGNTLAAYAFEVEADPGTYVLRVYDADMSGGEGFGEAEDTKTVVVR